MVIIRAMTAYFIFLFFSFIYFLKHALILVPIQYYSSKTMVPVVAVAYILFYDLVGSKNVNKDIRID